MQGQVVIRLGKKERDRLGRIKEPGETITGNILEEAREGFALMREVTDAIDHAASYPESKVECAARVDAALMAMRRLLDRSTL